LLQGEVDACRNAFFATSVIGSAFLLTNLAAAIALLNHATFSHEGVSDNSYTSAIATILATLDGGWLCMLASDEVAVREVKRSAALVSLCTLYGPMLFLQAVVVFMADVPMDKLDRREPGLVDAASGIDGYEEFFGGEYQRMMACEGTSYAAFAFTVLVGVWKLLLVVVTNNARLNQEPSPYVLQAIPFTEQWKANRADPDGYDAARRRTPFGHQRGGGVQPTHHMGYAIDEGGNYVLDMDGGYTLGPGVTYAYDADGNYALDEYGNSMLQDADGVMITEGYGHDGYGGYTGATPDPWGNHSYDHSYYGQQDNVTNTSRSTDMSFAHEAGGGGGYDGGGYDGGGHDGGVAPASMLWATCAQRCIFTAPDGMVGVFVTLPPAPDQPPYLFLQVHEQLPIKKSRFGKGEKQVSFAFLSVDVSSYGLDIPYVESNLAPDTATAWRRLQEAQAQLADPTLAAEAYGGGYGDGGYGDGGYGDGGYGEGGGYGEAGYGESGAVAEPSSGSAYGGNVSGSGAGSYGYGGSSNSPDQPVSSAANAYGTPGASDRALARARGGASAQPPACAPSAEPASGVQAL